MWQNSVLNAALQRCRETYVGTGPCYLPNYLVARYEYHKLLVEYGLLSPKLADRAPTTRYEETPLCRY